MCHVRSKSPFWVSSAYAKDARDAFGQQSPFQSQFHGKAVVPRGTSSQFEKKYFTKMCSGSEAGSYFRLIDVLYHSTLGLRVKKKRRSTRIPLWPKVIFAEDVLMRRQQWPIRGKKLRTKGKTLACRCRANSEHIRQSRPDSGFRLSRFQAKCLKTFKLFPPRSGAGRDLRMSIIERELF